MATVPTPPLLRQVARVRRRLFVQRLVNHLVWCWAGAAGLAALWFLIQPLALDTAPGWLRWAVAGGLGVLGTALAVTLAVVRGPSRVLAALSLDSEFGLKERVTTSLLLTPREEATPAGQALLADVNQRIRDLDVRTRFPLRLTWSAALVPAGVGLLTLVALFYEPGKTQATSTATATNPETVVNAKDIDQKMKELVKKRQETEKTKVKSEDLQKLEAELEKIANRPHDTKEQIRERIKEMTALEDAMKGREKEMADKTRSLKQQLHKLDQLGKGSNEGPAKDLEKALSEGKMDKAKEEMDKLIKRLEKNQLTAKEKEQLKKQLGDLKEKLEKAAQLKEKEKQLRQANLDPQTLEREMAALKKEQDKLKDLQDMANQLGKAQKALQESDPKSAADMLAKASDQMKNMDLEDQDLQDLRDQLKRLQDAKDSC